VTKVDVEIDDETRARLRRLADSRHRDPGGLLREAIEQYVAREEARDALHGDALESLARYRETGRHLTHAEVDAWLATWGTDEETGPPPCHD